MESRNLGWGIFMATYCRRGQVFLIGGQLLNEKVWDLLLPAIIEVLKNFGGGPWPPQSITCLRPLWLKKKKVKKNNWQVNTDMRWILICESYQLWKFVMYGTFTRSAPRLFCFQLPSLPLSNIYGLKILISFLVSWRWCRFLEDIIVDIFF